MTDFPASDSVGPPPYNPEPSQVPWLSERWRAYFYRLVTPIGAVAGAWSVAEQSKIAAVVALLAVALGGGLAIGNTSTHSTEG